MKNVFPSSSELAQKLQLVDEDERKIEKLDAYERRRRTIFVFYIVLVASLFFGRFNVGGVAAFAVFIAAGAGLLEYRAVRLRIRALERRRDQVLNSGSDEG